MEFFALRHMKVKRTSCRDSTPDPTPLEVCLPLQRVPALSTARPCFRAKRPWACPFRAFSSLRSRTRLRAFTLLLFLVTPTSGDSDVTPQLQGFAPRWSPPPPVRFLHRRKAVALLGFTPSRVFSSRSDIPSGTPLLPLGSPNSRSYRNHLDFRVLLRPGSGLASFEAPYSYEVFDLILGLSA